MDVEHKSMKSSSRSNSKWARRALGATLIGTLLIPSGLAISSASALTRAPGTKVMVKKAAVRKVAAKKVAVRKVAAKKAPVRKAPVKKVAVRKVAAKKVAAKKVAVRKVAAKKVAVRKVAAKKVAVRKPSVRKAPVKKPSVRKVVASKAAVKKVVAKKNIVATPVTDMAPPAAVVVGTAVGVEVSKKIAASNSMNSAAVVPVGGSIVAKAPVLPLASSPVVAPAFPLLVAKQLGTSQASGIGGKTEINAPAIGSSMTATLPTHPVKVLKVKKMLPTIRKPRIHRRLMLP